MKKARLLIIDDQAEVRAEIKDRILSLGHEADEAACQEQALQKIEGMLYECVLLDLTIPVKLEGPSRIEHGKNLLQRIVSLPDDPQVIVITSYGLEGHKLAVEMMEIGAKSFVAKPFDDGLLEEKIKQILDNKKLKPSKQTSSLTPFDGGALVLNDDGIELCAILIGGTRANAVIRSVVEQLARKRGAKFVRASAKTLAAAISSAQNPGSLIAAIKEFRDQCSQKLRQEGIECANDAVIQTTSGGYQFREWIQVQVGKDELLEQLKEDCGQVMRIFARHRRRTVKEVRESVSLPPLRVKAAMKKLGEHGKIKIVSGSGSTTAYEASCV